jgi:hypothetical protein
MIPSYDKIIGLKERSEVSTLLEESYSAGLFRGGCAGKYIRDIIQSTVGRILKVAMSTAAFISGIIIGIIGVTTEGE